MLLHQRRKTYHRLDTHVELVEQGVKDVDELIMERFQLSGELVSLLASLDRRELRARQVYPDEDKRAGTRTTRVRP